MLSFELALMLLYASFGSLVVLFTMQEHWLSMDLSLREIQQAHPRMGTISIIMTILVMMLLAMMVTRSKALPVISQMKSVSRKSGKKARGEGVNYKGGLCSLSSHPSTKAKNDQFLILET